MTVAPSASIEVSEDAGTLILRLRGELDLASREAIEAAVLAAIPTAPAVILDLGELTFCDSNGIAMFIAAADKAEVEDTVLTIGNVQPSVARVLTIAGIDQVLRITE